MELRDSLNGKNLLTDFSLIIQTGTAELLKFPERKERLTNDWAEFNGKEYDLKEPKFQDKEVTLSCAFVTDSDTDFWSGYNAFFSEITRPEWQSLYIHDHSKTYKVFYKSSSDFVKGSKRLQGVPKVFVKFELNLIIKNEIQDIQE